ncbi:hypothetical protein GGQ87_000759 [Brevundimonas alba]|uniref:Uncharacterized protein n=1 Tax=Brevundimonas alba TaxID=74314 RepID=A0A7X5YJS5_9CAUL|nr:hypothetical protein [Brevundimonas alba]NJC40501.1 hypothetical protein [Brevundimonas alba]
MTTEPFLKVRIVRAPKGEAPLWVREAWIGLELPLALPDEVTEETSGVLSGPNSWLGYWWARLRGRIHQTSGYVVNSARAIDILARSQPKAADWWRVNAPRFCELDAEFMFDTPACDPSPRTRRQQPLGLNGKRPDGEPSGRLQVEPDGPLTAFQ